MGCLVSAASCPHAKVCPGCALIDRPYAVGLETKQARVARAFARHAALAELAIDPIAAADPIVGYRRRAKLPVAGARIGAFAPKTHAVVDVPECRVLAPEIASVLDQLRRLLSQPPPELAPALGALVAVDARAASGRVLLTLIVDRDQDVPETSLAPLAHTLLESASELAGVSVSRGSKGGPSLLGDAPRPLAGPSELVERVGGVELLAVPGAFTQVHAGQAERIATIAADHLRAKLGALDGAGVIDLYGGSGALGLSLAEQGARVTIVESYAPAANAARRAAEKYGQRVRVVAEDASRFLASEGRAVDALVVNPPRRGVDPTARAKIAELRPKALAYVSCHPETLARDLAHFALLGLATERALPLDMIPLTEEVETVALLVSREPPPPRVRFEDDELLVVDKPPHEPTTPQGEHTSSLLARVRKLPGCERAAPLHRLDSTTSGVCVFGKTPRACADWAERWPSARKRYRALAVGITREQGTINRPLFEQRTAKAARTRYVRTAVVAGHSLLDVFPEQGRKHQIRRHLAGIGHPIAGDARHGRRASNRHFAEAHTLDRPFLHCARIEIGERMFESALAGDLAAVLDSMSSRADR